jgi:heme A synthase
MTDLVEVLLLAVALLAAWIAGSRYARRRHHPRFVHHSIGFIAVAVVAGVALLFYGPN